MSGIATSTGLVMLSRVRRRRCSYCERKSAMALVMPLADIGRGNTPGLGAIVVCGEHIEDALIKLTSK